MPHKIVEKIKLNSVVSKIVLEAPRLAGGAKAGQFIVLRIDEKGERIPLTVNASDAATGRITIIFQEVGKTTKKLAALNQGDEIADILGPLGKSSDFGRVGKVVFVAGGVGIAEVLPVARYTKSAGNNVTTIIGAKTKEFLILEEELKKTCDRLIIVTDDGSYGAKGLVTAPLKELLNKEKFDLAYCVGPDIMMRVVSDFTKGYNLKTLVSLDANMLDGTGMCGTCRVTVAGQVKFTCVDGPEFDGHLVDWGEFMKRQKRFIEEEKISLESEGHECRLAR